VIPWGANLVRDIDGDEVSRAIAARPFDRCNLVFLGRDWKRKGGDVFGETVLALNRVGLPTHGTIIGADPLGLPRTHFTVHPFIDKSSDAGLTLFSSLMMTAHFLLMPSRAEAYGQAFCEAMAFGVPAIGSNVGGIGSIVHDGETGFLRSLDTTPQEFAKLISGTLAAPAEYRRLAHAARADYRERLNWDSFGARLHATVAALV
jgi:glycosyltransferase involved in cell wall biosynthesis